MSTCQRLALSLSLVAGTGLAIAAAAFAAQGGLYTSQTNYVAGRSNIQRVTISPPSGAATLIAVRVQDADSLVLEQAGYIKHNGYTTPCGNSSSITAFVSWFPLGGSEQCQIYFVGTTGSNERYAVVRETGTCWTGYRSGSPMGTCHNISTSTGRIFTVGEYVGSGGTINGCFGCAGTTHWQVSTTTSPTNYVDVTTCNWAFTGSGWGHTCPPSPFSITH